MTPPTSVLLRNQGSESILSRNASLATPSLTASQSSVDNLVTEGTAVLTSYKSLVALGAFGQAVRMGSGVLTSSQLALGELSATARSLSLAARGIPALGAVAALITGCSGTPEGNPNPEIPDGSTPPPGTDQVCDDRRSEIQGADQKPAALQSIVNGITLPKIDFTWNGTPYDVDSSGALVSTITPKASDIVSYQKIGSQLYILTANKTDSGAYAHATVLVYKINPDNSTTPVITPNGQNAIKLGYYNPVAMAPLSGDTELDVLFGAPNPGVVSTVDPFGLKVWEADWCSTHSSVADGGSHPLSDAGAGGIDSGTGGHDGGVGGADGGKDAGVGGADGGHDGGADAGAKDAGPKDAGPG
jgi:hypothetical protein